jgi:hypothetical protein
MLATIAAASLLCAPADVIKVRVLVLNFNPKIPQEGGKPLTEVCGWTDPKKLSDGYVADVMEASRGLVRYEIKQWRDIDAFPIKADGFKYTAASYMEARSKNSWHSPDGLDYVKTLTEYRVAREIDKDKIDEVWIWGAPYFGFWESAMAGPGSFEINGGVYPTVKVKRPFAIMGFNYERGVAEMLHDLCHRTEASMSRVYGGWEVDKLTTNWARFAANFAQSNGVAAVGTCHWPPNAEHDYDYDNKREVLSTADDWLNYPNLRGGAKKLSCETWGGPDYHRNYMKWWFAHLPHSDGANTDARQNNWWKYVFDFWRFDERGLPILR